MSTVVASYYTDPLCPRSWALEPSLARLRRELGHALDFEWVMGGLARSFADPAAEALAWLEASATSGMPVDARGWLTAPLASSFPACTAVAAAAEQGDPGAYLRRLRIAGLCLRRRVDRVEALVEEARATPGLDAARFAVDLESNAIVERFGADLERTAALEGELARRSDGRVELPVVVLRGEAGHARALQGVVSFEELRDAAVAVGGVPRDARALDPGEALARLGPLAAPEIAALCDLPGPRAPAELWRMAAEWRARAERCGTGELWHAA